MSAARAPKRNERGKAWRGFQPPGRFEVRLEVPDGPSAWELLLDQVGLNEDAAIDLLRGGERLPAAVIMTRFIRKYAACRYVPIAALEAAGVAVAFDEDGWASSGRRVPPHRSR